ncbi:MAG: hypothetical protein NTZ83_04315 [Candidatus Pacearchaeota archaeon]|nr:hypothetical protein [Candidatus Pacearchaeota archaeon]
MTHLKDILLGLTRKPVVRQIKLEDTDLVKLDNSGFSFVRDGHVYWVKDELKDIVDGSKLVELEYNGEIRLNRKCTKYFQTFKAFKEAYNYIKQDFVKGEKK